MLHTSPPATLPKPKPKPPVAPADDIQLPPVGYNRRTPPNGYWTPPPKYEDIFARRSNPPPSPPRDQVNQPSLVTSLVLLISLLPSFLEMCIALVIVDRGEWLWSPENIKGASVALHNLLICPQLLSRNVSFDWFLDQKLTTTVLSYCVTVFIFGQGQESKKKDIQRRPLPGFVTIPAVNYAQATE